MTVFNFGQGNGQVETAQRFDTDFANRFMSRLFSLKDYKSYHSSQRIIILS